MIQLSLFDCLPPEPSCIVAKPFGTALAPRGVSVASDIPDAVFLNELTADAVANGWWDDPDFLANYLEEVTWDFHNPPPPSSREIPKYSRNDLRTAIGFLKSRIAALRLQQMH